MRKDHFSIILLLIFFLAFSIWQKENRKGEAENNPSPQTQQAGDITLADDVGNLEPLQASGKEVFSLPIIEENAFLKSSNNPDFYPVRNWDIPNPELSAQAALVINPKKNKILYQKNINKKLPIASLTKLMTAIIAAESASPDEIVQITPQSIAGSSNSSEFYIGEQLSLWNLLRAMLIKSSNDASYAISFYIGSKISRDSGPGAHQEFVKKMNDKANELNLKNSRFAGPSGFDSPDNYSTVLDLASIVKYISDNHSALWEITRTAKTNIKSVDGRVSHNIINTNRLLKKIPGLIGGKTGYTTQAKECLILVIKAPAGEESLIYIILGSNDRFSEMKKLVEWTNKAYVWKF